MRLGDVLGDISSRRGQIVAMENRDDSRVVVARIPLAEVMVRIEFYYQVCLISHCLFHAFPGKYSLVNAVGSKHSPYTQI